MSPTHSLSPQDFAAKWRRATLKERSAAQEHFIDLCRMLGQPTPAEGDPTGKTYSFEAGANKVPGKAGWADVWKQGCFAWEYKGKHADLNKAYQQLQQYRESLLNPPLLIVSDLDRIVIHTNFTNTVKRTFEITLDDIADNAWVKPLPDFSGRDARLASEDLARAMPLAMLHAIFEAPESFKARETTEHVTQEAARRFAQIAGILGKWEQNPHAVAHFLIRLLFCLFAEDIGLLPKNLFQRILESSLMKPAALAQKLRQLFSAMRDGGAFGLDDIKHFNGGLFDDDSVIELEGESMNILRNVAALDWSSIEPSIFGTLFERSLDPSKRAQLGAHYTSREDILLIVEPVLMAPLRGKWAEVQTKARELAAERDAATGKHKNKLYDELNTTVMSFADELARIRVLDPACGSGNFLYVALRQLLALEKEVITLCDEVGLPRFTPRVSPAQLFGIEVNDYAHELAQATVWIGYIQWRNENGFGFPEEPILRKLDNIRQMDAILSLGHSEQSEESLPQPAGASAEVETLHSAQGDKPREPQWPEADVIIGNPPFLGGKRLRSELGDDYVDAIFKLYDGRVPHEADLVCYWFEKARAMIEQGKTKRAGLLATQGIRGGANRKVLERIKETGDIFAAWSDRDWILDGATVHVSIIGFDDGIETERILDNTTVSEINPNLSSQLNLSQARRLDENVGLSFMGVTPAGSFDIHGDLARKWMSSKGNPHDRPNSNVLRPYFNGTDLTRGVRDVWIIDFGVDRSIEEASQYELPFEYVRKHIYPERQRNKRESYRERWWIHAESRPAMRKALSILTRYIATSMVSKHLTFSWVPAEVLPANLLIVIAREDDYFFGVLQSRIHGIWARHTGTQLREAESGSRYTPTTTFETFPFPWPPGKEPKDDPRVIAIAEAARDLVDKRDRWLKADETSPSSLARGERRTLTNLYNQRPTWLDLTHKRLDRDVLDAYGWPHDLADDEILARLLNLNLERAKKNS